MGELALELLTGGWSLAKSGFSALGRLLGSLNGQGVAGLIVSFVLALLAFHEWSDARHWHKQSDRYQALYNSEKSAFDQTVAAYRAAAAKQKADDDAKNARTLAQQQAVNQETSNEYEARLAGARAALQRVQQHPSPAANPGSGPGAAVPVIPTPACGTDTPATDPVTRAFDCAIQLDELISWTQRQHAIDPNEAPK